MSAIRLEVIASRLEAIAGGLDNVYQSLAADHVPYIANTPVRLSQAKRAVVQMSKTRRAVEVDLHIWHAAGVGLPPEAKIESLKSRCQQSLQSCLLGAHLVKSSRLPCTLGSLSLVGRMSHES